MDDTELRKLVREELDKLLPTGHKEYHESINTAKANRARMFDNIKEKTLTALLWSGIILIGNAFWDYIRAALGKV